MDLKITKEGYKKLKNEYKELTQVTRPKILEMLKEARSHGDLSENSDYDAAKNKQGEVEVRILEIEKILNIAKIITKKSSSKNSINLGSRVILSNAKHKMDIDLILVQTFESDPIANPKKISIESPLGMKLKDKSLNDKVTLKIKSEETEFIIAKIF